jgi:hypothetical protein
VLSIIFYCNSIQITDAVIPEESQVVPPHNFSLNKWNRFWDNTQIRQNIDQPQFQIIDM